MPTYSAGGFLPPYREKSRTVSKRPHSQLTLDTPGRLVDRAIRLPRQSRAQDAQWRAASIHSHGDTNEQHCPYLHVFLPVHRRRCPGGGSIRAKVYGNGALW
jgi:hypothetical protein